MYVCHLLNPERTFYDPTLRVMLLGMQAVPRSILASGTFFPVDWVMKIFHGHSSSSAAGLKKSSCQLMAKECTLSSG